MAFYGVGAQLLPISGEWTIGMLLNWVWMAIGMVLLVAGAELLVRGASKLALLCKISPLVVGLTVVAFGTSAPELAVSVASTLKGDPAIAIGNVVGSNIFNVLFILGLSAVITPLSVMQQLIRFDVPLMILLSGIVWGFAYDGQITRVEGLVLVASVMVYTAWSIWQSRKESQAVQAEYETELGQDTAGNHGIGYLFWQLGLVITGLVLLVLGSQQLVAGAVGIATALGVSSAVIGLTIIAAGTSLPEVATSVMAAMKGEKDIAVGNVIGSNIFNLLAVLGCSATVAPSSLLVPQNFIAFDLPVMFAVAFVCFPILFSHWQVSRWEGGLLLASYVAYTIIVVLIETDHSAAPTTRSVLIWGVVPICAFFVLSSLWSTRSRIQNRSTQPFDQDL